MSTEATPSGVAFFIECVADFKVSRHRSFMLLIDKLSIINDALLATGNRTVNADDGSDEWLAGSSFYDRSILNVMGRKDWKFGTEIQTLNRAGSSAFPGFADMFYPPADMLVLKDCWDALDAAQTVTFPARGGLSPDGIRAPPFEYKLIGGYIHCTGPNGVVAYYIPIPTTANGWPVGFVETLRLEIQALLMSGFNEDVTGAVDMKKLARAELDEARAVDDQQEPRRVLLRSSMLEARRGFRRKTW